MSATKQQLYSLVLAFKAELLKAKLDRDWNAVELFTWLARLEKFYGPSRRSKAE